jgi:hypothetical protein
MFEICAFSARKCSMQGCNLKKRVKKMLMLIYVSHQRKTE